ncbi:MAG TPA: putative glycolipid-binding domain-containing protein [Candidatus Dormibacteraeota bacterium]|nr:putative glycolipid-binding domain-containing protein [Candidatus Dormibacteraeota bacterium]
MANRSIVWVKEGGRGAEFAHVIVGRGRLTATGTAFGLEPLPYRLEYKLETLASFITSGILVEATGQDWSRRLDLRRLWSGKWTARTRARGAVDLPEPGGDLTGLNKTALDCDLAWSPLTNTMPVLRHGLLAGGGPIDFVMAWVSVPDLSVHASRQRYTFVRREGANSIVRYESASRDFVAELVFDPDGLVISYPGIGQTPQPR